MERVAHLSIGSNMGDSRAMLACAVERLRVEGVAVAKVSSAYRTSPVGKADQPDFLNAAVEIRTSLSPLELLTRCKAVEAAMGRDFGAERWGPRPIDIDIIFYGDTVLSLPELTIPHPRFRERLFVLIPLLEIAPGLTTPDGVALAKILKSGENEVFVGQVIEECGKI